MTQHQLPPDLQSLAALGKHQSFKKGVLIFKDGDKGDALYIMLEGRVRAFGSAISGKEITYGYVTAGEYFGELTLDGGNRSANVEAIEPSLCAIVSNAQLNAFMQAHPQFGTEMLYTVIQRARQYGQSRGAEILLPPRLLDSPPTMHAILHFWMFIRA